MIVDPEILRQAIIDKYGSQSEFAHRMQLSEAKVSRGVKNQSAKFLAIVKKAGINIDDLRLEDENQRLGSGGKRVRELEKRIRELEGLVETQNDLLKSQKDLLKSYQILFDKQLKKEK